MLTSTSGTSHRPPPLANMLNIFFLDPAPSKSSRVFSAPQHSTANRSARITVTLFYVALALVLLSLFSGARSPALPRPTRDPGAVPWGTSARSRLGRYPDMRVANTPPFQAANSDKSVAKDASARDDGIALINRTFSSTISKEDDPVARLIVLTMDRAGPLKRLLQSAAAADYGEDHVDIDIWIDRRPGGPINPEVLNVVERFDWKFGTKTIHSRHESGGLYKQWIYTWKITEQTDEMAVILEDDLELSKAFYQWLKHARMAYASDPEVGAFTLQRSTLRPRQIPGVASGPLSIPKDEHVFKYRLLGTWGFAPQRDVWVEFRAWFEKKQKAGEKPYVDNLVTTQWYKSQEKNGFASSMWSQWWIKFVDEKKYFTVTPHLPDGTTLCANWREHGMHYSTTKASRDFPIYNGVVDRVAWPESLMKIDWDGREIKQ